MTPKELNLDVSAEGARALHRVVRAMHDGHCPNCGHLGPAESFDNRDRAMHECPSCCFNVTDEEAVAALEAFRPHFQLSLEVFQAWRSGNDLPV